MPRLKDHKKFASYVLCYYLTQAFKQTYITSTRERSNKLFIDLINGDTSGIASQCLKVISLVCLSILINPKSSIICLKIIWRMVWASDFLVGTPLQC